MAQSNGSTTPGSGEQTPLLGEQRGLKPDDESSETITGSQGDEEELLDPDRANQQVGRGRGILIVLSLWGLIFLQGEFIYC